MDGKSLETAADGLKLHCNWLTDGKEIVEGETAYKQTRVSITDRRTNRNTLKLEIADRQQNQTRLKVLKVAKEVS